MKSMSSEFYDSRVKGDGRNIDILFGYSQYSKYFIETIEKNEAQGFKNKQSTTLHI